MERPEATRTSRLASAALAVLLVACAPRAEAPPSAGGGLPGSTIPQTGAVAPAGATAAPQSDAAASPPAPGPPLRVRLAQTSLSGSSLPVWVARDAGLFTQYGVDLELTYISTTPTAMAALLADEVDFIVGSPDPVVAVGVEGGDAVAVGATLNKIVQAIYAAPAYPDPASLRGHAVGITRFGALSDSSVRYLLRHWGLDPDQDVTLRQIGGYPEMLTALSAGAIEAGILPPPQTLRAKDLGFVELGNLWTTSLEYPAIVFMTRRERQPEREEMARRLLPAVVEGIHRTRLDRPLALRALKVETHTEDDRAAEEGYEIYTPLFERDLRLSRDAFRTALEEHARSDPRATSVDPDTLMDPRYVEEIQRSGLIERLYGP